MAHHKDVLEPYIILKYYNLMFGFVTHCISKKFNVANRLNPSEGRVYAGVHYNLKTQNLKNIYILIWLVIEMDIL